MELTTTDGYRHLLQQISDTYTQGRVRAVQAVNAHLIETYWQVGRHIVEFEQAGQVRAEYGKALIQNLAADLGLRHGKGFSRSNLIRFRQFYLVYPKSATLSHQLSWSHIVELLKLEDELERGDNAERRQRAKVVRVLVDVLEIAGVGALARADAERIQREVFFVVARSLWRKLVAERVAGQRCTGIAARIIRRAFNRAGSCPGGRHPEGRSVRWRCYVHRTDVADDRTAGSSDHGHDGGNQPARAGASRWRHSRQGHCRCQGWHRHGYAAGAQPAGLRRYSEQRPGSAEVCVAGNGG